MYCYECTYRFRTMSDRGFCESENWNVDKVTSKDRTTWVRNGRDWNWCFEDPVTHWMFLPEPPKRE